MNKFSGQSCKRSVQVLSFGQAPQALYLLHVDADTTAAGPPVGAADDISSMCSAHFQLAPSGAVPALAAVFDAAVQIRTLGKLLMPLVQLQHRRQHTNGLLCCIRTAATSVLHRNEAQRLMHQGSCTACT